MNLLLVATLCFSFGPRPAAEAPRGNLVWKPVQFAIVRFNEAAPQTWNIYHAEKHESLLIKLWKRYLLMDLKEQEIYDVDPQSVKADGENVQWSFSDLPKNPIDTSEWKVRDAGLVERIRFRFGKTGHFVDIELPLKPNGKIAY